MPPSLRSTLELKRPVDVAAACADTEPLLIVGFDLDAITAAEAALKIMEGSHPWADAMSTEFSLHGTPAVFRPGMNVITITPGIGDQGRTSTLRTLLAQLGANVWTCGSAGEQLGFAPSDPWMRPFTSILPFQRLTAELARIVLGAADVPRAVRFLESSARLCAPRQGRQPIRQSSRQRTTACRYRAIRAERTAQGGHCHCRRGL